VGEGEAAASFLQNQLTFYQSSIRYIGGQFVTSSSVNGDYTDSGWANLQRNIPLVLLYIASSHLIYEDN
jgi:hypothetical protein